MKTIYGVEILLRGMTLGKCELHVIKTKYQHSFTFQQVDEWCLRHLADYHLSQIIREVQSVRESGCCSLLFHQGSLAVWAAWNARKEIDIEVESS